MKISHRNHGNHRKDIADAISKIREIRAIRVRKKNSLLSVRSNFRVSLFFSRYFAINKMTVYAMEWECENMRKSENHAKIDIARQYQKSARRKSHTEITEITERILRTQYQEIR